MANRVIKPYAFAKCLMSMHHKHSEGWLDYYIIGTAIFLETFFLPVYPLVWRLHEAEHNKIDLRNG